MTANKAYCSVHSTFRYTQIQRNYKIRLHKTPIRPVLCHENVTWTQRKVTEHLTAKQSAAQYAIWPSKTKGRHWRSAGNSEIYGLADDIKIRGLTGQPTPHEWTTKEFKKKKLVMGNSTTQDQLEKREQNGRTSP